MITLSKMPTSLQNFQNINSKNVQPIDTTSKPEQECDLNLLPNSYNIPSKLFQEAKQALIEFQNEFGEIKSSTFICEEIKQAKEINDNDLLDELSQLRMEYSSNIKKLRKNIFAKNFSTNEEYIAALKKYIKENGSYMNCQECSDLMRYNLRQKGIRANNVFLYTVNKENERVSKAEHVFTVVGLDKKATDNPSTWGNCYIVDGWSGICLPYKDGIKYFENFFGIDLNKHKLSFEILE